MNRLLHSVIRRILREASGPEKIDELIDRMADINVRLTNLKVPFRIMIEIAPDEDGFEVEFVWYDEYNKTTTFIGTVTSWIRRNMDDPDMIEARDIVMHEAPRGGTMAYKTDEDQGECSGAYSVGLTRQTRRGWGPLLYDVAIEYATSQGSSLTSDRFEVSPDAQGVWSAYSDSRPDVSSDQLDIYPQSMTAFDRDDDDDEAYEIPNQLTPGYTLDDCGQDPAWSEEEEEWYISPLSRTYSKSPQALSRLKSLSLLIM